MKSLLVLLSLTLSTSAFTATLDQTRAVKNWFEAQLDRSGMRASTGIGACDSKTGGEPLPKRKTVYCVVVAVQDPATYQKLITHFPMGSKIQSVYISVEPRGEIVPQPRMSGGN